MTGILISLMIALPTLCGIRLLLRKKRLPGWVLAIELILICAGLLWVAAQQAFTLFTPFNFLRFPLYLTFSTSPALILAAVVAALGIMLGLTRQRPLSRWQQLLLHLSLPFGLIAFFSGQFMLRYIALEMVGLAAALTALTTLDDSDGFARFGRAFLILRLGDIGLWSAILILQAQTNTLDITDMINTAAALPLQDRLWVALGLLFAVLVKCAVLPFGAWLRHALAGQKTAAAWIPAFLMPALGWYLLYRAKPILQSHPVLQNGTILLALGLALYLMIGGLLKRTRGSRFTQINSLTSTAALFLAAVGSTTLLRSYFLGLVGLRLILWVEPRWAKKHIWRWAAPTAYLLVHAAILGMMTGAIPGIHISLWAAWAVLSTLWTAVPQPAPAPHTPPPLKGHFAAQLEKFGGWERALWAQLSAGLVASARWLHHTLETQVLAEGFAALSRRVAGAANWLQVRVEMGFESLWQLLGHRILGLSRQMRARMEDVNSEKSQQFTNQLLHSLEEHELQTRHKSFRWDLIWIPLLLLVILVFLFISQKGLI